MVIGLLLVALLPPSTSSRVPQRYLKCKYDLKTIELALHNYHSDFGTFPPAVTHGPDGEPWHNWQVLLLPYLEATDLYREYRFDEPWGGPHNRLLIDRLSPNHYYFCMSDPAAAASEQTTSYLAVVGEGTLWPANGAASLERIPDGPGQTVHLVEVWESGVLWMEPRDLLLESMTFRVNAKQGIGLCSRHGPSNWYWRLYYDSDTMAFATYADGSVRTVDVDTLPEALKSLLLRDDESP